MAMLIAQLPVRDFRKVGDSVRVPDLTAIQTEAYERFVQRGVDPHKRENHGLEAILREVFPIPSYDNVLKLEYLGYSLDEPRYSPEECRQLGLTYGYPLRIRVRLTGEQPVEEDVYLGDIPVMLRGGTFVVNGAERVIVSQLHRSPGIDLLAEAQPGEQRSYSCRIIPERGSWVEMNISKRDVLSVRIDQSGKFPVTVLLRAFSADLSTTEQILRAFYPTEAVALSRRTSPAHLVGHRVVGDIVDTESGEVVLENGQEITEEKAERLITSNLKSVEVITKVSDPLILNTLAEERRKVASHEEALLYIYQRLRPGNPPRLEKAEELFRERFADPNRYRLGKVGRFRINRKLNLEVPVEEMVLRTEDLVAAVRYLMQLRRGEGRVDDIDHLGNRRVRTLDELASDELRKGFLKLRRTVQERMSLREGKELSPRNLINSRTISAAIDYFFARSDLSQVVNQTNPLSQLSHLRRLTAMGPGGLNRKRAGFEVRDVHISHYGRICPIETPEGPNIGLITNLSVFATVDELGFLVTPYQEVRSGKPTRKVAYLRADEEEGCLLGPTEVLRERAGSDHREVAARLDGDFITRPLGDVQYVDVSPMQIVGISTALIPFLEHDDANRALMGANMQRQAVPLLTCEPPLVITGLERVVAEDSGMVIRADEDGEVTYVDAGRVAVGGREYRLTKFARLNEGTALNQRPLVRVGDRVKKGQVIADGPATAQGELSLGKNILVAFLPWDGYNFEDAIVVSERLLGEDAFTSVHIDEFEAEIRETKLGREEFTRDIPNVSDRQLRNLDEGGVIRVGTAVTAGDVLVGKITPKSKSELSPEEKLLYAIFGRAGEDVKNASLEVPSGTEGIVIDTHRFSRRAPANEEERKQQEKQLRAVAQGYDERIAREFRGLLGRLEALVGGELQRTDGGAVGPSAGMSDARVLEVEESFELTDLVFSAGQKRTARGLVEEVEERIEQLRDRRERELAQLRRGDELPSGVLEMVKAYVAIKRRLSVGDKMAGRHGNKGVISRIVPVEDMPLLADGTPVDMVLNPLGVPGRMNIGQMLETHLGWAAQHLGFRAISAPFDGASEREIRQCLREAGLTEDGQVVLYDGRSGEPFEQKVTVGWMYMMKLEHLVDDKVHARATGPYSLITQQPLGGKARAGGQRFGEMEVWALEAYGAAYTLQEMLTVKSDDVDGRTKIYESMVKGENALEAGTPVSFEVLTNEIKGLALNLELEKKRRL
jgi:DNA-directed RNA polymerase subunit beta